MKSVALYFVYAIALFNLYVWMIWPQLFYSMLWKWDIFITLLFAPIIYMSIKNETNT